mgnify:CR=1 FL=1
MSENIIQNIQNSNDSDDNNNNNNPNIPNKSNAKSFNYNNINFINEQLYPLIRHRLNLNPINLNIYNPIGDGKCLFRSISRFILGSEYLYMRVRREIFNEANKRINDYPDITLDTEEGPIHIHDYIHRILEDGFFGGELEISIESDIYNLNIATYNEIIDSENIIGYSPINYYHHNDNKENRHLLILINNNIHFRLAYYNNSILDYNYIIPKHTNENLDNLDNEMNLKEIDHVQIFINLKELNKIKES